MKMTGRQIAGLLVMGLVLVGVLALALALFAPGADDEADALPTVAVLPSAALLEAASADGVDSSVMAGVDGRATSAAPDTAAPRPTLRQSPVPPTFIPPRTPAPTPALPPEEPLQNQIIITFTEDASPQARAAYIARLGGQVVETIDALNTVVVVVPESVSAAALPEVPEVVITEPDYQVSAQIAVPPSDPLYDLQWGLPAIGAPEAWLSLPDDAPPFPIAIIDGGVCLDHPDLQGTILPGWDYVEDDPTPQDVLGHGCGVAGILAAGIDNGQGMAGTAPNVAILPLRVLDQNGVGLYSDVIAAMIRAVDEGARVINLSLGGRFTTTVLENAVDYAVTRGVKIVAAAGNTGGPVLYPAAYPEVIAVGSVNEALLTSSFSARGDLVDVWAPGENVLTTTLNGGYAFVNGTSFAAAFVAGAEAIEQARGRDPVYDGGFLRLPDFTPATPTPTTTPTAVPTPTATAIPGLPPQLSEAIQEAVAREYAGVSSAQYTPTITWTDIDGDWAYAVVELSDAATGANVLPLSVVILARLDEQGVWEARTRRDEALYNAWLEVTPLFNDATKAWLRWRP